MGEINLKVENLEKENEQNQETLNELHTQLHEHETELKAKNAYLTEMTSELHLTKEKFKNH
jgi:hypothetical protein